VTRGAAALVAGVAVLACVAVATALGNVDGSPVAPADGEAVSHGGAPGFLILLTTGFAAYVVGLLALRRGARLGPVLAVGIAVQVVPLAGPLLLSTDAWTYWGYGWIGAEAGGNPYVDPPSAFPGSPAAPYVGAAWRDTTTVYGPVFTAVSEPVARAAGDSQAIAAWLFRGLAAVAAIVATVLAARLSRRPARAAALVGWNPVLAIHLAGGGHNDALVGALLMAALALSASRRPFASGATWAVAVFVKWVPVGLFALSALGLRARGRPTGLWGFAAAAVVLAALATWLYGLDWPAALAPLAGNAARETSYALPSRLEQAGLPEAVALALALAAFLAGAVVLGRQALVGRARLGSAACLTLATTPYLAVWYLGWAVPLAAADDDDRVARLGVVSLTGYLLPQTIPL
jgi:hypothetical protein